MNASKCVIEGSDKTIGWACACGNFYTAKHSTGARVLAEECCTQKTCATCGINAVVPHRTVCMACAEAAADARELARYAAAKKVAWADYDRDMLWLDGEYEADFDDGFAGESYAYGCTTQTFRLDAAALVQDALDNGDWFEEAFENISSTAIVQLQAFLNAWCKEVNLTGHWADMSLIVLAPTWAEESDKLDAADPSGRSEAGEDLRSV